MEACLYMCTHHKDVNAYVYGSVYVHIKREAQEKQTMVFCRL